MKGVSNAPTTIFSRYVESTTCSHAFVGMVQFETSAGLVVIGGLFPLASWLLFLLYNLTIDVLRAILAIPAKLDALRR